MADNDPIKDYNPTSLKLEALQEKLEMYMDSDNPITDLHDCSNDLSDAGSRKEEYEHAKYAEEMRKKQNYGGNFESWNKKKKKSNNSFFKVVLIMIFAMYAFTIAQHIITEVIIELGEYFDNYIEEEHIDNYIGDYVDEEHFDNYIGNYVEEGGFDSYKKNISIRTLHTKKNATYIEVYNSNIGTYENLKIETTFYDEAGKIIEIKNTYINMLIAQNYHYFEIVDAPTEYASCEHNIMDNNGNYIAIDKENVLLEFIDGTAHLTNYSGFTIDFAEIAIVYMKENELVKIEKYPFYDLYYGETQKRKINLYEYENKKDIDNIVLTINGIDE